MYIFVDVQCAVTFHKFHLAMSMTLRPLCLLSRSMVSLSAFFCIWNENV